MKKIKVVLFVTLSLLLTACGAPKAEAPPHLAFMEAHAGKTEEEVKALKDLTAIENPVFTENSASTRVNSYLDNEGNRYNFINGYFVSMITYYQDQEEGFQVCMDGYEYIKKTIGREEKEPMGRKTLKDVKALEDLKTTNKTNDGSYLCSSNWKGVPIPEALQDAWDELYTGESILVLEMRGYEDYLMVNMGYAGIPLNVKFTLPAEYEESQESDSADEVQAE